jgi:hypothetical protein
VFNPGEEAVTLLAAPVFDADLGDGGVAIEAFASGALSGRWFNVGSGFLAT